MAFIRNTDKFIEGSKLFFSNERAKAAVQSDLDLLASEDSAIKLRLDVIEGTGVGSISKAQADAQAYADQKVAALVNSAPEVLDTLKELSDAIGGDASFAATVAGQIGAVDAKIDEEITTRMSEISELGASLFSLETRANTTDSRLNELEADPVTKTYVDTAISEVTSAYESNDQELFNRVGEVTDGLAQEILDRQTEDQNLVNTISENKAEFDFAYDELLAISNGIHYQLLAEITSRQNGDNALDARLDIIEGADTVSGSVAKALKDAKAYADSADALLSSRIDVLESAPGPDVDKAYVDAQVSSLQSESLAFVKLDGSRVMSGNLDFGQNFQLSEFTIVLSEAKEFYLNFNKDSTGESADTPSVMYEAGSHTFVLADLGLSFEPENFNIYSNDGENLGYWSQPTGAVSNVSYLSIPGSGGHRIINLADPVQNSDAATKAYVDGGVSGLQGQIDTEKGRIDAILSAADADKDSFAEIVQLINSVDTSNDSAFASYVLSNDAALAQEVSDRQAGDSALSSRLDVLEQDPTTKAYVDGVQSALDARIDSLELDSVTKAYVDSSKLAENIQTISSSTSVSSSSTTQIFFCNVSGGSVTVTLPSATAVVPGRKFVVKDTGSSSPSGNSIVVAAQAGQTVDGQSSFEMKMPFEAAQFVSDGSQWFVM